MRADDSAENCHNRRRQQDDVGARKTPQDDFRMVCRFRRQPCAGRRLDDEDESHEQRPDQRHGVEPPEGRVGELGPEI